MRASLPLLSLAAALVPCAALVPAAALAAGPFDGTYRGSQETIRSNNGAACASVSDKATLRIVDSHFTRSWGNPRQEIAVEVKPDGTVYGVVASVPGMASSGRRTNREYTVSGKITGGVLEAEIGSSLCAAKMTLRKE